jgi:hypothetical protein
VVALLLVLVSALGAAYFAFKAFEPAEMVSIFNRFGYYAVLASFLLAVLFSAKPLGQTIRKISWGRNDIPCLAVLLIVFTVAFFAEKNRFKVVADEELISATSKMITETAQPTWPINGFWFEGEYQYGYTQTDKRPILFPVLTSAIHSVFGFSHDHAYLLNNIISLLVILLVYAFARKFTSPIAALLSSLLFLTIPEFIISGNGGGLEPLNLLVIIVVTHLAACYLDSPSKQHLSALAFSSLLLTQTRPESVLYIGGTIVIILLGTWRSKRLELSAWTAIIPWLASFYVLQKAVYKLTPDLWQNLQTSGVMSTAYLAENLKLNLMYFFDVGLHSSNSLTLSIFVLLAFGVAAFRGKYKETFRISNPYFLCFIIVLGLLILQFALFQFYYAGSVYKVTRSRYTLPLCLFACLFVGYIFTLEGKRKWLMTFIPLVTLSVEFVFFTLPAVIYEARYDYASFENWKNEFAMQHKDKRFLVLGDRYPLIWTLNEQSGIPANISMAWIQQLDYLQEIGYFDEIFFFHLEYSDGAQNVDNPRDQLESLLELEPYELGQNKGKTIISRVTDIKLPKPVNLPVGRIHYDSERIQKDPNIRSRIISSFPTWKID